MDGLATVFLLSGDRNEARTLYTQAIRILSATLGPDHHLTVTSRAKLLRAEEAD
jgi:Tetratricopeptide repeat